MANELLEKPVIYEVDGEEIKLTGNIIKNFIAKGSKNITDEEVVSFLQLAKYQKLNPFLNEVYLVKFGTTPAQNIVSKEAFMKRAEQNPNFEGFKAGIIVERDGEMVRLPGAMKLSKDKLIGGWAEVYRSDRKMPIEIEISMEEFSKGQSTWKTMPSTMIRKTAIVNALREAFPNTLGALYTEEDRSPNEIKQAIPVKENKVIDKLEQKIKKADEIIEVVHEPEIAIPVKPKEQHAEQLQENLDLKYTGATPDFSREEGFDDYDEENLPF
ncbi:phage recombination protein Bet [Enterococcus nangangensis]|uniref:phage recombination protein Bet n=1 Tax=Enterococcus nangangensis TaxID=2559926 RepID=UPI0010F9AAB4|nr:phage recombination protein Bet [Enterococcus nangangensis]